MKSSSLRDARLVRIASAGVGYGGFLQVGLWLADNLAKQEEDLQIWLDFHYTGRAFRRGLRLLQKEEADIVLVNTRSVAAMAVRGRGLFQEPFPALRAIASLPHHDWCIFAVDSKLGIRSFSDLKETSTPLTLATGYLDGDSAVGFIAEELLRRHGMDPEDLRRRGWEFREGGPGDSRGDIASGRANAVCQEGVFSQAWQEVARQRPLSFLSMDPNVAEAMQKELGFSSLTVPANRYPGQDQPFIAPDFCDWLICVRQDMEEDLAYGISRTVVEKREELQNTRPRFTATVTFAEPFLKVEPSKACNTDPIPLHPGAKRYYREKGLAR